jgi:hypothetical protein
MRPPQSGTIYTPEPLALAIAKAVGIRKRMDWLDPCIGNGALVKALNAHAVFPADIKAFDLEKTAGSYDHLATTTRGVDFIKWASSTKKTFDRVIANPPYVSLRSISKSLQKNVSKINEPDGGKISLRSNYWAVFLLASVRLLRNGGNVAFILPAAFEYSNYSKKIKDWLPKVFSSVEVHRCDEPLFNDASDGCVILLAFNFKKVQNSTVAIKRFVHRNRSQLIFRLNNRDSVNPETESENIDGDISASRLGDIVDIRLGGVTGDNAYFLFTEEERRSLKLPVKCMRPVLTKSCQLTAAFMTKAEWNRGKRSGNRTWLFRPSKKQIKDRHIWPYILSSKNGHTRDAYKVKNRHPWYITPLPRSPDGFVSGMSQHGPWICLKRDGGLNATNTLYVINFKIKACRDSKAAWCLGLLCSKVRNQWEANYRRYPDGLMKWEPKDIKNLIIPRPPTTIGSSALYSKAISLLLKGETAAATAIADAYFLDRPPVKIEEI